MIVSKLLAPTTVGSSVDFPRRSLFGPLIDAASIVFISATASTKINTIQGENSIVASFYPPPAPQQQEKWSAIMYGGFLQPEDAYDPYFQRFRQEGVENTNFDYDKNNNEKNVSPTAVEKTSNSARKERIIGVGHSKGGQFLMANVLGLSNDYSSSYPQHQQEQYMQLPPKKLDAAIFVEPVDVNPPFLSPENQIQVLTKSTSLELEQQHDHILSLTPTLVIAAPFSGYSTRYGKMTNLCAPAGLDAQAFYDRCAAARDNYCQRSASGSLSSSNVLPMAPLCLAVLTHCGHNDVAKSSIRGCARGRDALMAPEATGSIMACFWSSVVLPYYRNSGSDTSLSYKPKVDEYISSWKTRSAQACHDLGVAVELSSFYQPSTTI